jgi:hypothetical protein
MGAILIGFVALPMQLHAHTFIPRAAYSILPMLEENKIEIPSYSCSQNLVALFGDGLAHIGWREDTNGHSMRARLDHERNAINDWNRPTGSTNDLWL